MRIYGSSLIISGSRPGVAGMSDEVYAVRQGWGCAVIVWIAMNGVLHALVRPGERGGRRRCPGGAQAAGGRQRADAAIRRAVRHHDLEAGHLSPEHHAAGLASQTSRPERLHRSVEKPPRINTVASVTSAQPRFAPDRRPEAPEHAQQGETGGCVHHVVVEIGLGARAGRARRTPPRRRQDQRGDALGVRGDGDDDADITRVAPARMVLRAMKNFLSRRSIVTGRYRPSVVSRVQPGSTMLTASAPSSTSRVPAARPQP